MSSKNKRVISIDLMRGGVIMMMVVVHFTENLSSAMPQNFFWSCFHIFTEVFFGSPVFGLLVGMSMVISLQKHESDHSCNKRYIWRGTTLFCLGLLFLFLAWGIDDLLSWDILTLLGFSMVVLSFLKNLRSRTLVIIGLAIVALSPWLREWFGFFDAWDETVLSYQSQWSFQHIMRGFFVAGYFPVFPWLCIPMFGFAIGKTFLLQPNTNTLNKLTFLGAFLLLVGCSSMLVAKNIEIPHILSLYVSNWTVACSKYPTTTTFLITSLGSALLIFTSLYRLFDLNPKEDIKTQSGVITFLSRYSTFSLTVYVIHHFVHLWPLRLVEYIQDTEYYANALPFYLSFTLAVLFIFLFYFILIAWEKVKGKYSFEWLIGKASEGFKCLPTNLK